MFRRLTLSHCTHPNGPSACKSVTCPGRIQYLKLLKTGKQNPTFIEEQHATDFTIAEYFKEEYTPDVPQDLIDVAVSYVEYSDDVSFVNHHKDGPEYITLTDMLENPKMFNNNCGPATWAVLELLEQENVERFSFKEHVLRYNEGVHIAILASSENGEEYVIDYTAKQYYSALPCPLVESRENWEKTIDTYVSMLYKDNRKND